MPNIPGSEYETMMQQILGCFVPVLSCVVLVLSRVAIVLSRVASCYTSAVVALSRI